MRDQFKRLLVGVISLALMMMCLGPQLLAAQQPTGSIEGTVTDVNGAVIPGATNDREVIKRAVAGCDGVLVVLAPMGVHHYASGTAQAVLDYADPGARLVFSCGWHITRDGQDVYSWKIKVLVNIVGRLARLARVERRPPRRSGRAGWRTAHSSWTSTTRLKRPDGCLQATRGGRSCAGATSRRARAKACQCGAGTWAIPFSRAT